MPSRTTAGVMQKCTTASEQKKRATLPEAVWHARCRRTWRNSRPAVATEGLANPLAVKSCDVLALDLLGALGLAGIGVGAGAEAQLIHSARIRCITRSLSAASVHTQAAPTTTP